MKSMKMSDSEQKEYATGSVMSGVPLYPWGLQITLDDESLKKLGIKDLPAIDQVMEITVKAQVVSLTARKEGNDDNCACVSLQITDMEILDSGVDMAAEKLYGAK